MPDGSRIVAIVFLILLPVSIAQDSGVEEFERTTPPKIRPAAPEALGEPKPAESGEAPAGETPADPYMEEINQLLAAENATSDTGTPAGTAEGAPDGDSGGGDMDVGSVLARAIMALSVTLAAILILWAVLKRWGRRSPLLAGHTLGTIMGRIALSPQASLHFIRVKDEVLVVGVTQQSVNLLRTMDAALFDGEPGETASPSGRPDEPLDFLSEFRASQEAMKDAPPHAMDEELDTLRGDLQRLKQYFQESTRAKE